MIDRKGTHQMKMFYLPPKKRNWLNEVARATARNFLLLTLNIQIERRVHKLTLNVFIGIFFFGCGVRKDRRGCCIGGKRKEEVAPFARLMEGWGRRRTTSVFFFLVPAVRARLINEGFMFGRLQFHHGRLLATSVPSAAAHGQPIAPSQQLTNAITFKA